MHIPGVGYNCDDEAGEVQQRKGEDSAPRKGVADATVERVGLVLVKSQDVRSGFCAGEPTAQRRYTGSSQHCQQPDKVAAAGLNGAPSILGI